MSVVPSDKVLFWIAIHTENKDFSNIVQTWSIPDITYEHLNKDELPKILYGQDELATAKKNNISDTVQQAKFNWI